MYQKDHPTMGAPHGSLIRIVFGVSGSLPFSISASGWLVQDPMLFRDGIFKIEPLCGRLWPQTQVTCACCFLPKVKGECWGNGWGRSEFERKGDWKIWRFGRSKCYEMLIF